MYSMIVPGPDAGLGGLHYTQFQTPRGTRDFGPGEGARKSAVEHRIRQLFYAWGYEEVITPTFEFANVLELGDGTGREHFRFFDRDGHLLMLRPEMTTPIARLVATRLRESPRPLRLCYVGSVFRHDEPQAGRQREFTQAGVELFGSTTPAADAEVIALAARCLEAVGLRSYRIDIGHVGYVSGLMDEWGLEERARRDLRAALLRRDYVFLETRVAELDISPEAKSALMELPRLRGGADVLRQGRQRAAGPRSLAAVENLEQTYALLAAHGVQDRVFIDFGLVKDLEYYTGMVLEGYTKEIGYTLCTGGRYDNLAARFGEPCPATGFALGVERLLLALDRANPGAAAAGPEGVDVYVTLDWRDEPARAAALAAAAAWRERGLRVAVDVDGKLWAGGGQAAMQGSVLPGAFRCVAHFQSPLAVQGRFLLYRPEAGHTAGGKLPALDEPAAWREASVGDLF